MGVNPPFSALASLGLGREEMAALAKQGSVRAEDCGQGRVYYRLRFRVGCRQCVRYVGNSPGFAEQIRHELRQLQARTRSRRQLRVLVQEARKRLRKAKHRLEPMLPSVGRVFHGRSIRQPRVRPGEGSSVVG